MIRSRLTTWIAVTACCCALPISANALVIGANYIGAGWDTNAKNAFFFAENQLARYLPTSYAGEAIIIDADWQDIKGLAGTLSRLDKDFDTIPWLPSQEHTFYPSALANYLHGSDLSPGVAEMTITFDNSGPSWYFGTDGNPGNDKYDFVTIAMHEIMHGLGFWEEVDSDGNYPKGFPSIYDRFLAEYGGEALVDLTPDERKDAIRSDNLYWDGVYAVAANGGEPVKLFAPSQYIPGSSVSHLDQAYDIASDTYGPTTDLMNPAFDTGDVFHALSPQDFGMLQDMGWVLPEPQSLALLATCLSLLAGWRLFPRRAPMR